MPFRRIAKCTLTNLKDAKAVTVETLRITFDIKKSRKGNENIAKIEIYNLSEKTRDEMTVASDEAADGQTAISLEVGYADTEMAVLFKGVGNFTSEYQAPDWVSTIEATDGVDKLGAVVFEKKYLAGTPVSTIVTEIATQSGMPFTPPTMADVLKKSRTFSGPVSKIIGDLETTYKFTFNVDNESIKAKKNALPGLDPRDIVTLDLSNGLVNYPRKRGQIVEVQCLINPAIRPNGTVLLVTQVQGLTAAYSVKKIDVKGDSWNGDWTMYLELENPTVPLPTDFMLGGVLA